MSPVIQSDTDEDSDANANDSSRNSSYSSRYSNNNLSMGLSSTGAGLASTSYNGNDSNIRSRFDHTDGGGGSIPTNGVSDYDPIPDFTKRLLSFRNHNIASSAAAKPSISVLDSSKSMNDCRSVERRYFIFRFRFFLQVNDSIDSPCPHTT